MKTCNTFVEKSFIKFSICIKMPKEFNEELAITYANDYNDFLEDLPNRLAPLISQLHELDYKLQHKMNKIEANNDKLAETINDKKRRRYSKRAEKHLKRIKHISEEKLQISSKIIKIVKKQGITALSRFKIV